MGTAATMAAFWGRLTLVCLALVLGSEARRGRSTVSFGSFQTYSSSNTAGNDEAVEVAEDLDAFLDVESGEAAELGEAVGGLEDPDVCSGSPHTSRFFSGRVRPCNKTAVDDDGSALSIRLKGVLTSDLCETCHADRCGHRLVRVHEKGGLCLAQK